MFSKPENFLSEYKIISQDKRRLSFGTFDQFKIMYEDMIINQKEYSYNSYDNLCKRYSYRKLLNDNFMNHIFLKLEKNYIKLTKKNYGSTYFVKFVQKSLRINLGIKIFSLLTPNIL